MYASLLELPAQTARTTYLWLRLASIAVHDDHPPPLSISAPATTASASFSPASFSLLFLVPVPVIGNPDSLLCGHAPSVCVLKHVLQLSHRVTDCGAKVMRCSFTMQIDYNK